MSATQLDLFAAPELADQAARDDAVHRIDTSFVVSAGAGAGKTETLIRRLEQVLAHGGDPSRIVAITFTERAARDLVNKLRAKLPSHMTAAVEQMTVGTIHSFCLGILRRHPLEAGLPPVFSTQDELLAGTDVRDRALRIRHRMFERVQALDDPALREALDVLVAENGIGHIDALIGLVDQQWDRFDELEPAVPAPWQASCHQALARVRELAHDREVPLKLRVLIQDLLPGVDACLAAPTMAAALLAVPSTTALRSTGGPAGKPARDEVKSCLGAVKGIVHDTAVRHLAHVLVPIVLEEAHARYQSGSLSFDDILVLTRRLLTQQPALCRRIRAEIDHLCVDEFQDTDVVQYDIVQVLTAPAAPSEIRAVRAVRRRRRRAAHPDPVRGRRSEAVDLRLPRGRRRPVRRAAPAAPPHPAAAHHELPLAPAVLRWVNALFRAWFDADQGAGQVPFSALDHHVPDAPATVTVIGGPMEVPAELAAQRQARDLARMIAAAHGSWTVRHRDDERPATYGDIAVLVRTRADLTHLEPALRRAGIPYVIEGGALLYDTREVRDLLRVLTAINDTASPIKVVTALRTSVLALSDVELVAHRNAGGNWSLHAPADRRGHPAVLQALTTLRTWADARHRTPMPELLDQIARSRAAHAASLVDGAPTTTWRRLRLVLDEARWWYEQTGGSLGEYLAWIALRVENDDRSNVTTDETDEDSVHILTVHAAKGLEFPIVMVAGMGRQRPGGDHVRAAFATDIDGRRTVELKYGKLATLGFDSTDDRVLGRLEAARLAYVACTRAKDHVVVCLHHGRRSSATTAAEMMPYLPETDVVVDLPAARLVDPPAVVELDDRVDRPPARETTWKVRSSWSATQMRHRDDDAPVAVPTAAAARGLVADDTAFLVRPALPPDLDDLPPDTEGDTGDDTSPGQGPRDVDAGPAPEPGESVHSKPPRPFGALPDQIGRYGTRVGRAVHGVVQVLPVRRPAPARPNARGAAVPGRGGARTVPSLRRPARPVDRDERGVHPHGHGGPHRHGPPRDVRRGRGRRRGRLRDHRRGVDGGRPLRGGRLQDRPRPRDPGRARRSVPAAARGVRIGPACGHRGGGRGHAVVRRPGRWLPGAHRRRLTERSEVATDGFSV